MSYYNNFTSEDLHILKKMNDEIIQEETKQNPNKDEILKLKQRILMKGMEMSVGFNVNNYNPYI